MTTSIHANLAWLPRAPAEFNERYKALTDSTSDLGTRILHLAGHALDGNQLARLGKAIDRARLNNRSLSPLTAFRLGLVSNSTVSLIVPALIATAARHRIALECVTLRFDEIVAAGPRAGTAFGGESFDAVLIAIDHHGLPMNQAIGDAELADKTVVSALQYIDAIRSALHGKGVPACIVQTVARPPTALFGSFDCRLTGTPRQVIDQVNLKLAESLDGTEDILLDVAGLAELVGLGNWHDATQWNLAKLPFSNELVPIYADYVCRLIAALRGKSRRCLILDLDNTLWSGVVGDDGLEGIILGQGDPTGEAHLDVQQTALRLRDRGIVLAISSKNSDEIARRVFRDHPEMLLKEEHISAFHANWDDKATNIQAIAEELSLGLESMVFLDDNPSERALVRRLLPDVAVPELPPNPALYSETLLAAGYFEAITFTIEDRQRAAFYQTNARRAALEKQAINLDSYLASLEMAATFLPFDASNRARIVQLINKTNQFNLTTKRYSEAEVSAIERDPECFTLQVRLADAFGDNGMISVVICRRQNSTWLIDTWLMSCRVLGRKVEAALLGEMLHHARQIGVTHITGVYRPTERNGLVADHYKNLGFAFLRSEEDGTTFWDLDVTDAMPEDVPIKIRRAASAR